MERQAVWGCLSWPLKLEEAGQCALTAFCTLAALQTPAVCSHPACGALWLHPPEAGALLTLCGDFGSTE